MSVEALNVMHVHAQATDADQVGMDLECIIEKLGPVEGCIAYSVVRGRHDPSTWIVSSHWETPVAMEQHFQGSDLSAFMALLSTCGVHRIQITSFLAQHLYRSNGSD